MRVGDTASVETNHQQSAEEMTLWLASQVTEYRGRALKVF